MNGHRWRWIASMVLAATVLTGCQSAQGRRAALAQNEPGLTSNSDGSSTIVQAQPAQTLTFADRHPLFSKPREYYGMAGNNRAAKVAAATVVGIPAGIVGELKQIVVGRPPDPSY